MREPVHPSALATFVACLFAGVAHAAPPVAVPDGYATPKDTELVISAPGHLSNDFDPDGDTITWISFTLPANGTMSDTMADGSFIYEPDPGFVGVETIDYTISDGNGGTSSAFMTINVYAVNRPPVTVGDAFVMPPDDTLVVTAPGHLGNDFDLDGDTITWISFTLPANGTISDTQADGSFIYEPDAGFTGTEDVTYTISDGQETASGTLSIVVTDATTGPPVAVPDGFSTPKDTALIVEAPGHLENDFDPDGDTITWISFTLPANGTMSDTMADGSFIYEPNPGFVGVETIDYTISDGNGGTSSAFMTINVYPVNRPPVTVGDGYVVLQDQPFVVNAPGHLGNDFDLDGDTITWISFTLPANGTMSDTQADGSFIYEPNAGFTGTDNVEYTISDGQDTNSGTMSFVVGPFAPTLTLLKEVVNDEGGTAGPGAFTLVLTGADSVHDAGVEYPSGAAVMLQDGVEYTVTELPLPGYELVGIACEDAASTPIGQNGVFTPEFGQQITCTVTNDDTGLTIFEVTKDFDDDNPAEVQVTISCNTGLPLEQSAGISEGDGVTFVVKDFEHGAMDCTVTETAGADGYAAEYFDGTAVSTDGCTYEDVLLGDDHICEVTNTLLPVEIEVTKTWVDDNPQFASPYISEAAYACVNVQFGNAEGTLFFNGNPDTETFSVFPHWDGTTTCTVVEDFVEGGVETDDSACEGLSVTPGAGASCEIVNTRLYEGIPTLSRTSLALLAMLMLGIGLVVVRRL